MPSDETVGHSHAIGFRLHDRTAIYFASGLEKNRAQAFLEIMQALEHGLSPASAKLLHKRFKHLVDG